MKHVIKIASVCGSELHTRQTIEQIALGMKPTDEYLLDMSGVVQVSRSAADELYNLTHGDTRVEMVHLEPFVEKMLSAVTLGRFLPRKRVESDLPIVRCSTMGRLKKQLQAQ